jgi:plastocyanin
MRKAVKLSSPCLLGWLSLCLAPLESSALVCSPLRGAEAVIEMFQASFLPQTVTVDLGDDVTWVWRRGEHTVTSGAGPSDPQAGRLFDARLDAERPNFTFRVREYRPEGYPFFCRLHPDQVGFLEIASGEVTFRVGVVDNVFQPEEIYIFEGDFVKWEHEPMEGYHTVTSGASSLPEDRPGELFDEESSDLRPVFVYQFTRSAVYPYFCIPHEHMGMKGKVHVQATFVRGDTSGNGTVDISDAVATLDYLFLGASRRPCADALDVNDDGKLDITDPVFTLRFLFLGGAELPAPYPRAAGDRTDDQLVCWR